MIRANAIWSTLAPFIAVIVLSGCSPYADYCADRMDCEGGNDSDIEACIVEMEADEDKATVYDCSPEWEDLFDCRNDHAVCDDVADRFYASSEDCGDEADEYRTCEREAEEADRGGE